MKKRILSLILVALMAVTSLSLPTFAADDGEESVPADSGYVASSNQYAGNYTRTAAPINSYLYENEEGGLTRVEYVPALYDFVNGGDGWGWEIIRDPELIVEDYTSDFTFLRSHDVPLELDIWGGFFAGDDYNFLIFGQTNPEEDDSCEVIRVVKYTKDWQRLENASLYGANTTIPFRAGSLRCDEYNGMLYIRTSHEMYTSDDGLNHQANLTMAVRESDMTVTDSYYVVMNSSVGYVSHSFNQFVIIDSAQNIVTLDHGDAYPRTAVLMVYQAKAGGSLFSGRATNVTVQQFPGTIGYNYTGASLGGLTETENGYAIAYNYDGLGDSVTAADRSVYFSYVNKGGLNVTTKVLSGMGAITPQLVSTGLDGGYILWNESDENGKGTDTLHYAKYTDGGNVGTTATANAVLSDCQPILYNGKVVWYSTGGGSIRWGDNTGFTGPTFYTLDENGVTEKSAPANFDVMPHDSEGYLWLESEIDYDTNILTLSVYADADYMSGDAKCTQMRALSFEIDTPNAYDYLEYRGYYEYFSAYVSKRTAYGVPSTFTITSYEYSGYFFPSGKIFEIYYDITCYEDAEFIFTVDPITVLAVDGESELDCTSDGITAEYKADPQVTPPATTTPPMTVTPPEHDSDVLFWMDADIDYDTNKLTLKMFMDADYYAKSVHYNKIRGGHATLSFPYQYVTLDEYTLTDTCSTKYTDVGRSSIGISLDPTGKTIPSGQIIECTFSINCDKNSDLRFTLWAGNILLMGSSPSVSAEYRDLTVRYAPYPETPVPTTNPPASGNPATNPPTSGSPATNPPTSGNPATNPPVSGDPETTPPADNPNWILGDVNNSGALDAGDATLVLRDVVGNGNLTPEQRAKADTNRNGIVDAGDATIILRTVVGANK